jgi:phage terminase large subunit-like protein
MEVNANPTGMSISAQIRAEQMLTDYKLTPATLMARLDPSYIASKWVLYLSWKIAQAVSRGSCGLLISAPPRHGKSRLATIATPLWVLENFPKYNVGVVTYGEDLSTDFSREIRDYVQKYPNLLDVRLRQDVTRVANFLTTSGGGLKAVGLRGTITGRGFNVLVIDDYIKEPKEAESATYLEGLYTWYQTVARTRLEPGAVIIILATRWVKNDLHGKLMKLQQLTGRNFFEYVSLPALAYDPVEIEKLPRDKWPIGYPDVLGRNAGEPLFPERYTQVDMENMRAELQSRWWDAMFQQNPKGDEGTVIDISMFGSVGWQEYQEILKGFAANPDRYKVGRYWDMASTKDSGDYTVGARGILDTRSGHLVIDSVVRGQWNATKAHLMFKNTAEQDIRQFGSAMQFGMEKEPGSQSEYAIKGFQEIIDGIDASFRLKSENASGKGSKLMAAGPFIAAIEQGKVGLLANQTWLEPYTSEVEDFPEGLHDDQVDATGGLYRLLKGLIGKGVTWGRGADVVQAAADKKAGILSAPNLVWGKRPGSNIITPNPLDNIPPGMEIVNG